jgi:hypothetical protein
MLGVDLTEGDPLLPGGPFATLVDPDGSYVQIIEFNKDRDNDHDH